MESSSTGHAQAGSSMVDILTLVVLVGILLAFNLPAWQNWRQETRLVSATDELTRWREQMLIQHRTRGDDGREKCAVSAPANHASFVFDCKLVAQPAGFELHALGAVGSPAAAFHFVLNQDGMRSTRRVPPDWGEAADHCWVLRPREAC